MANKNTSKIIIVIVLLVIASVLILPRMRQQQDAVRSTLVGAMGQALAAEIGALGGPDAAIVCIGQQGGRSMFSSQKAVQSFGSAAKKEGHRVIAEEYIPLSDMHVTDMGMYLKASTLKSLAGQHPDATVLVSFVGVPYLAGGDADPLDGSQVKLTVLGFGDEMMENLLGRGIVDLALVFGDETPVDDKQDVSREELRQYISFRKAGG